MAMASAAVKHTRRWHSCSNRSDDDNSKGLCSETMYIAIQGWVGSGAQSEGECIMRILCFLSQEVHDAPTSPLCPTIHPTQRGL